MPVHWVADACGWQSRKAGPCRCTRTPISACWPKSIPTLRKPEGPFGDHLGYYSLAHNFPVLRVRRIYHRAEAIWPFTVVGRPPQEDSVFASLIHEITAPLVPSVLPGVHAVHAVDAAGVHPLLLALGSERYVPFEERQEPQELLTQANAILGQGQLSLAKYLFMAAVQDDPRLDVREVSAFLQHVLARVDWRRDLHFQTQTTIDTLDYSGTGLNRGSKLVVAAVGRPRRTLPTALPPGLRLPDGFADPRVCLPGVLAVRTPACTPNHLGVAADLAAFCAAFRADDPLCAFPLLVLSTTASSAATAWKTSFGRHFHDRIRPRMSAASKRPLSTSTGAARDRL